MGTGVERNRDVEGCVVEGNSKRDIFCIIIIIKNKNKNFDNDSKKEYELYNNYE